MKNLTFNGDGSDFSAGCEAEKWLRENGYSYGYMQGCSPRAIAKGDIEIEKWRNISREEKDNVIDGYMDGDPRSGPVFITIKENDSEKLDLTDKY
jgi:hypothetical protein